MASHHSTNGRQSRQSVDRMKPYFPSDYNRTTDEQALENSS